MSCPKCNSDWSVVIETRESKELNAKRRRRLCKNCSHRFSTYEMSIDEHLKIVKSRSYKLIEEFIYRFIFKIEKELIRDKKSFVNEILEELDEEFKR